MSSWIVVCLARQIQCHPLSLSLEGREVRKRMGQVATGFQPAVNPLTMNNRPSWSLLTQYSPQQLPKRFMIRPSFILDTCTRWRKASLFSNQLLEESSRASKGCNGCNSGPGRWKRSRSSWPSDQHCTLQTVLCCLSCKQLRPITLITVDIRSQASLIRFLLNQLISTVLNWVDLAWSLDFAAHREMYHLVNSSLGMAPCNRITQWLL